MSQLIKIDGELFHIEEVQDNGYLPSIETEEGEEFYLAEDSESAGEKAREVWEDMAKNDPKEFACIIGEKRLVQWGLREYDSFGINSMENFFEVTETVPEEEFAKYDGRERSVDRVGQLADELGFIPTVAYRSN